jgi:uncharacterized protein
MADLKIEWDTAKSRGNLRKHGVSFEEAASVFYDDNALLLADPDHSIDEDRFVLLGISAALRIVVVCHCYRTDHELIRIISARKASKAERLVYAERWKS